MADSAAVLNNVLYLIMGSSDTNFIAGVTTIYNDMYSTTDGVTWSQVCSPCMPTGQTVANVVVQSVVGINHIFMFGGIYSFSNSGTYNSVQNSSTQVWHYGELNDCVNNPCQYGGTCIDGLLTYTCNCPTGASGHDCATVYDSCTSSPCQNGASCIVNPLNFTCTCPNGYRGNLCQTRNGGAHIISSIFLLIASITLSLLLQSF